MSAKRTRSDTTGPSPARKQHKCELPDVPTVNTDPMTPPLDSLCDDTSNSDLHLTTQSPVNEAENDEQPVSRPASPEQEVVDVESYQPHVVDLTNEEEDDGDVEVVAQEQSVIFLGMEQRRRRRRRRLNEDNTEILPQILQDLVRPSSQANNSVFESGSQDIIREAHGQEQEGNTPLDAESRHNRWPQIDFQNPTLLFGDLFSSNSLSIDDEATQIPQPPNPLRELNVNDYPGEESTHASLQHNPMRNIHTNADQPLGEAAALAPPQEPSLREAEDPTRQHSSRSRSPFFLDATRGEAVRSPDIVQDIHEMQTEVAHRRALRSTTRLSSALQIVAEEHYQRLAQVQLPLAPSSPPPREQPVVSCLVCLDSIGTINESSRTLCSTTCGHVFCSSCIEEVVKRRKQCPVCRKKLTKRQYHPLFI